MNATDERLLFRALHFMILWPLFLAGLYLPVAVALAVWGVNIVTPLVTNEWAWLLGRIAITSMGIGGLAKMSANMLLAARWKVEISLDGDTWEKIRGYGKGNLDEMQNEMGRIEKTHRTSYYRLVSDRGEVDRVLRPSAMELDE